MTIERAAAACRIADWCRTGGTLAALLWTAWAMAEPPAPPPDEAQAAGQAAVQGLVAELGRGQPSAVRQLDPAIFIELTPVTAAEPAVRLPEHQQERVGPVPAGES